MLTVKLIKSPSVKHKYRVIFPDKRAVDFGAKGYSDYTIHKNPVRMRAYVVRHGGLCLNACVKRKTREPFTGRCFAWTNP